MSKLLLVEDDNNLREIYQERLSAEGYDIVAAQNGEEALSIAKQEHPDLIISDVMMPRISGLEMLDILRNTDELRDTKVIMLTALGQAEDQARAGKLGADKYLVKSQVTLEDIVNCAHDLLSGKAAPAPAVALQPVMQAAPPVQVPVTPIAPLPATPAPTVAASTTAAAPVAAPIYATPVVPVVDPDPLASPAQYNVPAPAVALQPVMQAAPPVQVPVTPIAPLPATPAPTVAASTTAAAPVAQTVAGEEATVEEQIEAFTEAPQPESLQLPSPVPQPISTDTSIPNDATLNSAINQLDATAETLPAAVLPPSQKQPPADAPFLAPASSPQPLATPTPPVPNVQPNSSYPQQTVNTAPVQTYTASATGTEQVNVAGKKIIHPINDIAHGPNLDELLAKEAAKEQATQSTELPIINAPVDDTVIPPPQTNDPSYDPNSIAL